jgi:hypothetical protein
MLRTLNIHELNVNFRVDLDLRSAELFLVPPIPAGI